LLIAWPLMAGICDATCARHAHHVAEAPGPFGHASHQHDSPVGHEHAVQHDHSRTEPQTNSSAVRLTASGRICDNDAETIVTARNERASSTHEILLERWLVVVVDPIPRPTMTPVVDGHGPPGPIRTVSPLRI